MTNGVSDTGNLPAAIGTGVKFAAGMVQLM
jgi:hypothetical protein